MENKRGFSPDGGFGLWISIINRSARSYFHHKLQPYGVGPGQQAYLLALLPEEEITQDELSRRLNVDKANVTRAMRSMAGLGYVAQNHAAGDARVRLISLTDEGIKVRKEIAKISEEWIDILKTPLSEQTWKETEASLKKIAEALREQSFSAN